MKSPMQHLPTTTINLTIRPTPAPPSPAVVSVPAISFQHESPPRRRAGAMAESSRAGSSRLFERFHDVYRRDEGEAGTIQPAMRSDGVPVRSPVASQEYQRGFLPNPLSFDEETSSPGFGSQQHSIMGYKLFESRVGLDSNLYHSSAANPRSNSPILDPRAPSGDPWSFPILENRLDNLHLSTDGCLCRKNGVDPQIHWSFTSSMCNPKNFEAIMDGKGPRHVQRERRLQFNDPMLNRVRQINLDSVLGPRAHWPSLPPLEYDGLMHKERSIYSMALDRDGSKFLQRTIDNDKGERRQVDVIFNATIDHVAELIVDPFGNFLMQKLLVVCSEEQRMMIILVLTRDPFKLVRISMNNHGSRAVLELIDTLKIPQQIALVTAALKPGVVHLIKNTIGSRVIQHCLESLPTKDNQFIFDAATKNCVDIATHQHGCIALQPCIEHSAGEQFVKLVAKICDNGYLLAQDAFGNYVVQYILRLGYPIAAAKLESQFQGKYVELSMHKCSSNVVQACLNVFSEEGRAKIVLELLSVPQFKQLLQHPYANFVIKTAVEMTKGPIQAALVQAICPHEAALRNSPFCRRIFSLPIVEYSCRFF